MTSAQPVSLTGFTSLLEQLCQEGKTGTFHLATDLNHTAAVTLRAGQIVGVRYRISRNLAALQELLKAKSLTYRFEAKEPLEASSAELPETQAVLTQLKAALAGQSYAAPTTTMVPAAKATTVTPHLPASVKALLESALAEHIGPMASIVAGGVFNKTGNVVEALDALAAKVPDPVRAQRFKQEVEKKLKTLV
jgi:hypothetical protein